MEKSTIMTIECAYCHHIIGKKEGHGQTGPTSDICNACLLLYYPQYAPEIMTERYGVEEKTEIREAA